MLGWGQGVYKRKVVRCIDWKVRAEELYAKSKDKDGTFKILKAEGFLVTRATVREHLKNITPQKETYTKHEKTSYKNGEYTYEIEQEIIDGREITPDIIMEAKGLKTSEWEVVSFCKNVWQQQTKEGTKIDLCQSKLTVKPKKEIGLTFEDIDNYFLNADFTTKRPLTPFTYHADGEVLEIDLTDTHNGLLSWREETGADYDLNIVEQRVKECIADVIRRCKGRNFKRIILVTLGDILHIDNDNQTTTKGTFQQADGRMSKIFNRAVDMMIDCIDCLLELKAPIEYIYTAGNHDRTVGYCLAKTIQMAYRKESNITFDISPNPQKVVVIGQNLIGLCHGDMAKQNLGEWLQTQHRREYGLSRYSEVHCGHLHSESVKAHSGILVKHLPTICESSYWEHQQGYKSDKGMMCFIWNEETGLRETWYNYI